jgi:predicted nucleic acid-binding protein
MPDRPFVDTNVLVYAVASAAPDFAKGSAAKQLIQDIPVCLSTQVLGEFYNAVVSLRQKSPLTYNEAIAWIQIWKRYEVFEITTAHVDLALEIVGRFKVSYYDALIISAARLGECDIIYSEDLNDGQDYGGVRVQNPF